MLSRALAVSVSAGLAMALSGVAEAQPVNVRSWYAQGQVFVVWERPALPALSTDIVEIYASPAAQASIAAMTRVGRLFFPEYTGARLEALLPGARLQVPTPAGGTYSLAPNEGVFAYTPHQAGSLFFAVVDTGSIVVNAGNSASTFFNYDPINEPVRPHPQFSGFTPGGNPYTASVVWADGRDNYNDSRPDFPIIADADKNGVPHVFTISEPVGGLPAGPLSALIALHGGGGEYQLFRPGIAARANMSLGLLDGVVITPDDSIYARNGNSLDRTNTSWFGYTPEFDPFIAGVQPTPLNTATVVNFTSRRVLWILDWFTGPRSPYPIDPTRVAIVGHSGGGRGSSVILRQQPQRFCAAVHYTPASFLDFSITVPGENYLRGDWSQQLATNLIGPDGSVLSTVDVFTMHNRLSPTERDLPPTRIVWGKRDENGTSAGWSSDQRAFLNDVNDSRQGIMVFWDEREHGVEQWSTETNDATDDPAHTNPWPDVGQWVAPIKTERSAARYLVSQYRSNQSYPGFFNADADALLGGRQPDPGSGNPDLGDPFGTWGGYFDWETTTLTDEPNRWAATIFATGLSAVTIDNSPFAQFTTDLIPRRAQLFKPSNGKLMRWSVINAATLVQLQSGSSIVEPDGTVVIPGVVVPRDPSRIRVQIGPCLADFNHSGAVSVQDIFDFLTAYFTNDPSADINDSSSITVQDIFDFLALYFLGC